MSFAPPLNWPFHGTYERDDTWIPFTVALDDHLYAVDVREYRRLTETTVRESVATSAEPSDALFNVSGAWYRYRHRWDHGAGADFVDLKDDEPNPARFNASVGIDPWDPQHLQLHRKVAREVASTEVDQFTLSTRTYCWFLRGTSISRTADLLTWETVSLSAASLIRAVAADGEWVYIATEDGIYRMGDSDETATELVSVGNWDGIGFVANHLLASSGRHLYEVASDGSRGDPIMSHYQASFRWTAMFAVGSRIFVGGYAGNRSELYTMSVTGDGSLAVANEAAPLPSGELLRAGIAFAGLVVLCTSRGVRVATLGGDSTLTYGPALTMVGDTRCAYAEGNYVWVGWSEFPTGGAGLARLRLDAFTSTLVPAWASDMQATDVGAVTSCARFSDRTVFCVAEGGFWKQLPDEYVDEGWVSSGQVFFGTVEPKVLVEAHAHVTVIGDEDEVQLVVRSDDGDAVGAANVVGPRRGVVQASLVSDTFDHAEVTLTLTSGDGETTPRVNFWRLRAFPVPPAVEQWIVPLLFHSTVAVNDGQGQALGHDVVAEMAQLRSWWSSKEVITYREGDDTYRVRVDAYEFRPARWDDRGYWFEGTMLVRLVSA